MVVKLQRTIEIVTMTREEANLLEMIHHQGTPETLMTMAAMTEVVGAKGTDADIAHPGMMIHPQMTPCPLTHLCHHLMINHHQKKTGLPHLPLETRISTKRPSENLDARP